MYLACIEIEALSQSRVLQEEFVELEPAKVWAVEEAARREDATGNAAVFETAGPLMAIVWERSPGDIGGIASLVNGSKPVLLRA